MQGCIIRMNSKEFSKKFLKKYDQKDFQFIVISENIKDNKQDSNVISFPRLIPPSSVISKFIDGDMESYKSMYLKYLQSESIDSLISIIVKGCVVDNFKIILLCTEEEDEYNYLKLICKYIETVYNIKTFSFKQFNKDPEVVSCKGKKLEQVKKIVGAKINNIKTKGIDINEDNENIKDKLKKLSKDELYKLAKSRKIKVKKDMGKKEIIKKIIKKINKNE